MYTVDLGPTVKRLRRRPRSVPATSPLHGSETLVGLNPKFRVVTVTGRHTAAGSESMDMIFRLYKF